MTSSNTVTSVFVDLQPGYVFAGKYRIERKLGEGGMGAVYAARHLDLGGRVALKVMLASVSSTEASSRFKREARAASMLRGEHVVRTLDAGKLTNGTPYIVLEYIEGKDLDALLDERGPLSIAEVVALIVQACEGVAEAHALGMVHRDLTLRNMLLTKRPDGTPLLKILDFGVVKISANSLGQTGTNPSMTLTHADAMIGSTHYMAPEQIHMSNKVDARADVWSLGVCLYRLLTGKRPFDGATLAQVLMEIVGRDPKAVDDHRRDIPPELARAVERALEKAIHRRFEDVAELAGAIAPLIGDHDAEERIGAILRGGWKESETIRIAFKAPPAPVDAVGSADVDADETETLANRPPLSWPPRTIHSVAPPAPPPSCDAERGPPTSMSSLLIAAIVGTVMLVAFLVGTTQGLRTWCAMLAP